MIMLSAPLVAAMALSALTAAMLGAVEVNRRLVSNGHVFEATGEETAQGKGGHLRPGDTIASLMKHPAFAGFAHLLLPWDDRTPDDRMPLRSIGSLLPYHSHVDVPTVVDALNHMIDDVGNGESVFHQFYTEGERTQDPGKARTGLFFFRGKPGAPFALIAPGGGFSYVASVHEGFPYAVALAARGSNAFVLKYRVGSGGDPATRDLAAAISYVFRNAKTLGVGTEGYSLWGSSAGARMAAAIGSHGVARFGGGPDLPKPSAVVMAYTGHSDHSRDEPPTFVLVGEQDGIAPPSAMETRVRALRAAGTEVEFHRYTGVGHGFGPGIGTSAEGWLGRAAEFWERATRTGGRRRVSTLPPSRGDAQP
jgi:acetyl esterase/lipase